MIILGLTTGHDASAALFVDGTLVAYCKEERMTRKKQQAGRPLHQLCIDEVLKTAGVEAKEIDMLSLGRSRLPADCFMRSYRPARAVVRRLLRRPLHIYTEIVEQRQSDEFKILNRECLCRHLGMRSDARVSFVNHHYAHALGAFKFTTWEKDALYVVCDAAGDGTSYAVYYFDGEALHRVYGGDEYILQKKFNFAASIGIAYSHVTKGLGFRANRHEGKITGLAAFGRPVVADEIYDQFIQNPDFSFDSRLPDNNALKEFIYRLVKQHSREDMAASIQAATERFVLQWIDRLLKKYPVSRLGLSGGVFANVRLNQKVSEMDGIEEVFVFPAMGDEGLSVGNCVAQEIRQLGLSGVRRYRLDDVYLGYPYSADELLREAQSTGFHVLQTEQPAGVTARLLADNHIGAVFAERMEMGPRALGARSIVASPARRELNDTLNQRLNRTEFMPFAPYVCDTDADEVFVMTRANREACRFMTITTDVREQYKEAIQAVVHVDGTARPQIIERRTNALYYDILQEFKALTGIPCLVNTSFNAHEEPIINKPAEALKSLREGRIDFLVSENGLVFRSEADCRRIC